MEMPGAHYDFSLPFSGSFLSGYFQLIFPAFVFTMYLYNYHSSSAKLLSFACESEVVFLH